MTSISNSAANSTEKAEPVLPVSERVLGRNEARSIRTRKGRVPAAKAPISVLQAVERMAVTVGAEAPKASGPKPATSGANKTEIVLKKLRTARGATIAQLGEAMGWQAHSLRGFLSAVVRKKLALPLVSEPGKDGVRRYRITENAQSVE